MSEQQFLDQLKQLKIQITEASETVKELAVKAVKEQDDQIKQNCFLNMFADLNNTVEDIDLMIESIDSKIYELSDDVPW